MKQPHPHPWVVTPTEAREIQNQLRDKVITHDQFGPVTQVAGVDVGFEEQGRITRAAIAVLEFPSLEPAAQAIARLPTSFPYVPGLLSFRETPVVLAALEKLETLPQLLLCDGQGLAHPRRFGIACHLGVLTGIPTIGVAKTRLTGTFGPVPEQKGGWVPLMDKGECIGAVLRSRTQTNPLFISSGHRIGLPSAIRYVMACTPKYRLPETTRQAHRLASGLK